MPKSRRNSARARAPAGHRVAQTTIGTPCGLQMLMQQGRPLDQGPWGNAPALRRQDMTAEFASLGQRVARANAPRPQAADYQPFITTIGTLAMDAVQKAKSGHPGTPMALAPLAYTLWQRFLRYDPGDPHWPNRDRFVLSAGPASMLLYAMLHCPGF